MPKIVKRKNNMTLGEAYLRGGGKVLIFFGGAFMLFFAKDVYDAFKKWLKT